MTFVDRRGRNCFTIHAGLEVPFCRCPSNPVHLKHERHRTEKPQHRHNEKEELQGSPKPKLGPAFHGKPGRFPIKVEIGFPKHDAPNF